jgi:hypothetical protein
VAPVSRRTRLCNSFGATLTMACKAVRNSRRTCTGPTRHESGAVESSSDGFPVHGSRSHPLPFFVSHECQSSTHRGWQRGPKGIANLIVHPGRAIRRRAQQPAPGLRPVAPRARCASSTGAVAPGSAAASPWQGRRAILPARTGGPCSRRQACPMRRAYPSQGGYPLHAACQTARGDAIERPGSGRYVAETRYLRRYG